MNEPTKKMRDVLVSMLCRWELGQSCNARGRHWLQLGGIGRGGISENVGSATVCGLYDRGLVELNDDGFPTRTYRLTRKGRRLAKEIWNGDKRNPKQ